MRDLIEGVRIGPSQPVQNQLGKLSRLRSGTGSVMSPVFYFFLDFLPPQAPEEFHIIVDMSIFIPTQNRHTPKSYIR
jgi:hypothetical protein